MMSRMLKAVLAVLPFFVFAWASAAQAHPEFGTTVDFDDYVLFDKESAGDIYSLELYERRLKEIAEVGFKRVVTAEAAHHDKMIAYTSQLCHIVSSAYVRDELAPNHDIFSAGSFRDMVRVGAPDPKLWSELFLDNRESLLPVLE